LPFFFDPAVFFLMPAVFFFDPVFSFDVYVDFHVGFMLISC